jgi:hypothetical protein
MDDAVLASIDAIEPGHRPLFDELRELFRTVLDGPAGG